MTTRATVLSLAVLIGPAMTTLATPGNLEEEPGIVMTLSQDASDPALLTCAVRFTAEAPVARVQVRSPLAVELIPDPGTSWSSRDEAETRTFTLERLAGLGDTETSVLLDLRDAPVGSDTLVVAERTVGPVACQVVAHARRTEKGVVVSDPLAYRITHVPGVPERSELAAGETSEGPRLAPASGSFVVEPMTTKVATLAEVFAEDTTDRAIPEQSCAGAMNTFGTIAISGAPAGALVSGYQVHVTVTHAAMSHVQIGFFKHMGTGSFLWNQGSGVNLDQTFTGDYWGQPLPGIGTEVNDSYQLGVRDCTAGTTGTLTYWSLRVQYGSPDTIDLVADSVGVSPNPIAPGATASVTYQGHVGGTGTVGGAYILGFYLSTDANITTGDVLLDQVTVSTAVNPGDTFGQSAPGRSMTIPGGTAAGSYHLGMIVDRAAQVTESNEGNNTASTPLTVAAAQADLETVSCSLSPATANPGGSVSLQWQGRNAGTAATGAFSWGIYLSTDAVIQPGVDTLLTSGSVGGGWAAGYNSGAQTTSVTVPASVAPGSYSVGLYLDSGNAVAESNETDNSCASALTVVAAGQANLEAVSCSVAPSTAEAGDSITLTWRGSNSGSAASPVFTYGVYLSSDATITPGADTLLASASTASEWSAGFASGDRTVNATIPAAQAAGSYFVGIYLDSTAAVAESNETDNDCASALQVTASATGVTHWLVPAAASTPGLGTSDWRSQVAIANSTAATRTANVYYVAKGASWPGVLLSGPITLAANRSAFLDDPLLSQNPTSGLLYVVLDEEGPVVTSRTYNLGDGGATFGQGIPAQPLDGVSAPTELVIPMVHSVPGHFHTNLGLVQTSAGSYTVEVTAYSSAGWLAFKNYTRSAAYDQITDIFDDMGIGSLSIEGAWIRVRLVAGSPSYWTCYASVIDDLTGDPTYVVGVRP